MRFSSYLVVASAVLLSQASAPAQTGSASVHSPTSKSTTGVWLSAHLNDGSQRFAHQAAVGLKIYDQQTSQLYGITDQSGNFVGELPTGTKIVVRAATDSPGLSSFAVGVGGPVGKALDTFETCVVTWNKVASPWTPFVNLLLANYERPAKNEPRRLDPHSLGGSPPGSVIASASTYMVALADPGDL